MTTIRVDEQQAAAFLARHDRVMSNLTKKTGPFHLPRPSRGHFAALAESILHQQLAGAAARAIHGRFVALFDGDLSPEAVLAVPPRRLRAAGLSGRKVVSMRDLAAKVVDGTVPLHRLGRLADEDRSEEHTSELQSQSNLVCRLLLEKKKKNKLALVVGINSTRVTILICSLGAFVSAVGLSIGDAFLDTYARLDFAVMPLTCSIVIRV